MYLVNLRLYNLYFALGGLYVPADKTKGGQCIFSFCSFFAPCQNTINLSFRDYTLKAQSNDVWTPKNVLAQAVLCVPVAELQGYCYHKVLYFLVFHQALFIPTSILAR